MEFDGEEGAEPFVDAEIAQIPRGVGAWNRMDHPADRCFEGLRKEFELMPIRIGLFRKQLLIYA